MICYMRFQPQQLPRRQSWCVTRVTGSWRSPQQIPLLNRHRKHAQRPLDPDTPTFLPLCKNQMTESLHWATMHLIYMVEMSFCVNVISRGQRQNQFSHNNPLFSFLLLSALVKKIYTMFFFFCVPQLYLWGSPFWWDFCLCDRFLIQP